MLVLLLGPLSSAVEPAVPATLPEYVVKAGFLYNFALFVDWPPAAFTTDRAPFVVGIVGDDPFGEEIDRSFARKVVRGRAFLVRRLSWGPALRECHILFVASSASRHLPALPALLAGTHVLTVGDDPSAARHGAIVAFVTADRRVGLEIDVDRAGDAALGISSKMLAIARVRRGGAR